MRQDGVRVHLQAHFGMACFKVGLDSVIVRFQLDGCFTAGGKSMQASKSIEFA